MRIEIGRIRHYDGCQYLVPESLIDRFDDLVDKVKNSGDRWCGFHQDIGVEFSSYLLKSDLENLQIIMHEKDSD